MCILKQILFKNGEAFLEEVPPPVKEPNRIIVQLLHSCISVGTEIAGMNSSGEPLWKKALKQPKNVKKVLEKTKEIGLAQTYKFVKSKVSLAQATGYSASGRVVEVGDYINDIKVGDLVACAGAGLANHAELVSIPRNLACKIPESLSTIDASTVTLGAIALQGVRRFKPTIGEMVVVVGLGSLGQLTCQILKANGCEVLAIDKDINRIKSTKDCGIVNVFHPDELDNGTLVNILSNGYGADGVIITAASKDDKILSEAFKYCRKKEE